MVFETLHQVAAAEGPAPRAASWPGWSACCSRPPRWRPATWCAPAPAACAWGSAPPPSWTPWPRSTPAAARPGRCWNGPTTSAPTSAWSPPPWSAAAWPRSRRMHVRAGQPGAADAGPAPQRAGRDPGQARRGVRGRVQVRRHPGAGPPHRRRRPGAVHPPAGPGLHPVPRGGEAARQSTWGRARRSWRARWSPSTPPPGSCARSRT